MVGPSVRNRFARGGDWAGDTLAHTKLVVMINASLCCYVTPRKVHRLHLPSISYVFYPIFPAKSNPRESGFAARGGRLFAVRA